LLAKKLEKLIHLEYEKMMVTSTDFAPTKLGDMVKCVLGGTPSRVRDDFWGGDVPWINSGKINEFRIVEPSEYITTLGLSKSNTTLMPKGTTVLAITGATLGQVSILGIDSCANQSVKVCLKMKSYLQRLFIQ